MTPSLASYPTTSLLMASLQRESEGHSSSLQAMVEILKQPRVRSCPQCQGKGLLSRHVVCSACKGFGRTA